MLAGLRRWAEVTGDGYILGPVRAAVAGLLAYHALLAAKELIGVGYFGDVFHLSMVPPAFFPTHGTYAVLVAARVCLAVMALVGIWTRPALATCGVLGLWLMLCDRLQFHHNRYSLHLFAILLSLTPCDRSWALAPSAVPTQRRGHFWAVRLLQLQVSIVYLSSGGSKLLDADWRSGVVVCDRIVRHAHLAIAAGVPKWVVDVLSRADVSSGLAKLAIVTELVLCAGLWLRPMRVVALWWGVWFHLVIQATARVETFTLLMFAVYGVFVTPDFETRKLRFDPSRPTSRAVGTLVPLLDWFGRFEVKPWEPDDRHGHSIVVVRRDGGRATGLRAFAMLTRCLPLLFPLWAPATLIASFTRSRQ